MLPRYFDYFNSNRHQTKYNTPKHTFLNEDLREDLDSLYRDRYKSSKEPRLQSKYGPSAGLDTRKLLQVTGRWGTRGERWKGVALRSMKETRKEGGGGVDGDRGCLEWRNGWKFLSCKVINYRQPLTNTLPSFAGLLASSVLGSFS